MAVANVKNYLKNVTKSIAFSAADVGKDIMPDVAEFARANVDFVKQTYSSIKMPKIDTRRKVSALLDSKIFKPLDYGIKNIKSDLASGDFYNRAREEQDLAKFTGFDFGDLDDLSEFGIDDDWEKQLNKTSDANVITKGDQKVASTIERSSAANASATVNAIIATSDNATKNARANTGILYEQNERLFGGLHKDLSVIGATLTSIFNLQHSTLQNIDKNTADYYSASLKLENERNAILREMLEMQRNQYKSAKERDMENASKRSSKRKRWSDVNIGGIADLDKYFENVKDNITEELSFWLPSGSLGADLLSAQMVTPMRTVTTHLIKSIIPSSMKASMKAINETIGGVFANIISSIDSKKYSSGIGGILARVLGIDTNVDRKVNTGNYEKGAVPWDGVSRRSVINVIPGYLRRIEAYISGQPELDYDFNTGKWVRLSHASQEFQNIRKEAARTATYDLAREMNSAINKARPNNASQAAEFDEAFDEFRQYLYDRNGRFYPNESRDYNGVKKDQYPLFYKYYNKIATAYKDFDLVDKVDRNGRIVGKVHSKNSKRMAVAAKALSGKDQENRKYREYEAGGYTSISKFNEYSDKIKPIDGSYAIGGGILNARDKSGNSIYSYLSNINRELQFWRLNYGDAGFGSGAPVGAVQGNSGNRRFVNYNNINLTTREQRKIDRQNKKAEAKRKVNSKDPNSYKREALKRVMSGTFDDLNSFSTTQAQYLFELSRDNGKLNTDYRELVSDAIDESRFEEFFKDQFKKGHIRSVDDVSTAMEKAIATGKKTNEVLSASEKSLLKKILGKFSGGKQFIDNLLYAPAEAFNSVLLAADRSIYEMFFNRHLKDDGTEYDGFIDFMIGKTDKAFKKLTDAINEKIIDPLKKKLGLDEFKERFVNQIKETGRAFGGFAKQTANDLVIQPIRRERHKIVDKRFSKLSDEYKKSYRDEMYYAGAKGGSALNSRVEKQGFSGSIEQKKKILLSYGVNEDRINAAIKNAADPHEALNKIFNRVDVERHAAGTSGIPYVGTTMLSEGEMLFNDDGVSMVNKTGAYNVNKPTHILNSRDSHDILSGLGFKNLKAKSSLQRDQAKENIAKKEIFGHAKGTFDIKDLVNRGFSSKEASEIFSEAKGMIPETAAGGAIGAGVSLAFGLIGGPLVGGAIGAGATMIAKSKTIQSILFGKMGEDGVREDNGIIKKSVQDVVKKYAPDMGKFGLAGLVASMVTPLGPIGGILAGGAIGFLKNNDAMREKLFGKLNIGEDEKSIVKKMLPGALKGAGAGVIATLFGGPFGLMGNAILGSAIGMMASTDEFNNGLLGRMVDGVRQGGILGAVKDAFEPLRKAGEDFKVRINDAIQKNIFKPLSDFVQPAIHAIPQLLGWLPRKLNDMMDEHFGWRLDTIIKDAIAKPIKLLMKPVEKIGAGIFKMATAPFKLVGAAGNMIRGVQMSTGNAGYMTADDRIKWRNDHKVIGKLFKHGKNDEKQDQVLASLSADKAKEWMDQLSSIDDSVEKLNNARDKSGRDINDIIGNYKTADGKTISGKAKKEIAKAINSGDTDKIPEILRSYSLDGSDTGLTDNQIKSLMNDTGLGRKLTDYKDLAERQKRARTFGDGDRDAAKQKLMEALKAAGLEGFDISSRSGRDKLSQYLKSEYDYKRSDEWTDTREEERKKLESANFENIKSVSESLESIVQNGIRLVNNEDQSTINMNSKAQADMNKAVEATTEKANAVQEKNKEAIGEEKFDELDSQVQEALRADSGTMKIPVLHRIGNIIGKIPGINKVPGLNKIPGLLNSDIPNPIKAFRRARQVAKIGNKNVAAKSINAAMGNSESDDSATNRIYKLSNINGLQPDEEASNYAAGLPDAAFKYAYKVVSNKWISKFLAQRDGTITKADLEYAYQNHPFKGELDSRCKIVCQAGASRNYKTLADILAISGTELANLKNSKKQKVNSVSKAIKNAFDGTKKKISKITSLFGFSRQRRGSPFATASNDSEASSTDVESIDGDNDNVDNHFLGTLISGAGSLIGGAFKGISSLFSGGDDKGDNKTSSPAAKVFDRGAGMLDGLINSTMSGLQNAGNKTTGDTDEVDVPGDGRDVVQIGDGYGLIKRKSDGSIEPDTSDSHTKDLVNKMTMKENALNKLQGAQLKASEAIHNAFGDGKIQTKAKKGLGWLSALLIGGMLWKSGIVQKVYDGFIKPLWTDKIKPWWDDKAWPWIKDTALPAIGNVIGIALKGAVDLLIEGLPGIISGAISVAGGVLDAVTGNKTNSGHVTKVTAKNKEGMSGMTDENGNTLSWSDIESGNFNKIYNAEGTEGTVNEDGTVSFKDPSFRGSSYVLTVGNAAAHAFLNPKVGAMAAKTIAGAGKVASTVGLKGAGLVSKAISAPISVAANAGSAVAKWGAGEVVENAAEAAVKTAATTASGAKTTGLLGKLLEGLGNVIKKLFENSKVLKKISDSAVGAGVKAVGEWIGKLKGKVTDIFKEALEKAAQKCEGTILKQAAEKIGVITAIIAAITDFLVGFDQAESILGVTSVSGLEAVCAGLINALCNFLIVPAIIPGVNWIAQKLFEFFGDDLEERQKEAEEEYNNYVAETGSTKTKEEYLKSQYSVTGKVGDAVGGFFKKVGSGIWNGAKWVGGKIADGAKAVWDGAKWVGGKITDGAKGAFDAVSGFVKDPLGTVTNAAEAVGNSIMAIPGKVFETVGNIGDTLSGITKKITGRSDETDEVLEKASKGEISILSKEYWTFNSDKEGILGTLDNLNNGIIRVSNVPIVIVKSSVNTLKNKITDVIDGVKDFFKNPIEKITSVAGTIKDTILAVPNKIGEAISNAGKTIGDIFSRISDSTETDEVIDKAMNGEISVFSKEYWSYSSEDTGIVGALNTLHNGLIRVTNAPMVIIKSAVNAIVDGISNIGDWLGDVFEDVADFFEDPVGFVYDKVTNGDSGRNTKTKAKSSTKPTSTNSSSKQLTKKYKFGKGYSKQNDPSIANIRYNSGSDHEYQTIGNSGCGPAAAVNALESIYGRGSQDVVNAANFAVTHGYKETDGGTRPEFFADYFGRNGYASSTSSNKNVIARNIYSGMPTVIMGKDSRGTSNSTPFGKVPHYVTVTGVDSNGHAIVQDPESKYDNQLYSVRDLMSKTQLGISATGAFGRGRYGRGERSAEVWNWFTTHGYTDAATAGILGNMYQESGVDPEKLQSSTGPAGGIVQWESYRNKSLRWKELYDYANSKGRNWTDLESQLEFIDKELSEGKNVFWKNGDTYKSYEAFKQANNIGAATQDFEKTFERAGKPMMEKRLNAAQGYYDKFGGTGGTPISNFVTSAASNISGATGDDSNGGALNTIGQILSSIIANSPAGKLLNSILGIGSSSTESTASSGDVSGSTSGIANTASGDAASVVAIAKQEADAGIKETPTNQVKYNDWYYGRKVNGSDYPWCAAFVSWVANQAGISTDVIPKDAYTVTSYQKIGSNGSYPARSEAKPGDIVFFTKNGGSSGIYHTGIVEGVQGGNIYTIEGNSSDMVKRHTYAQNNSNVLIARPNYKNTGSSSSWVTNAYNTLDNVYNSVENTPDYNNTRGGNGIKPISKFGSFKDSICGRGSAVNHLPTSRTSLKSKEGYDKVEYSGWDRKAGETIKKYDRKVKTVTYGKSTTIDYSALLKAILEILVKVASNTDKLNTIVSILNNKLNINITAQDVSNAQNGATLRDKIGTAIAAANQASKNSNLNSYADTVNNSSMQTIIAAMNAIASE